MMVGWRIKKKKDNGSEGKLQEDNEEEVHVQKTVDLEDASIFCRIFRSLDAGELMVNVLKLLKNIPAKLYHEHIDTIQVCLEMLCIVTKNDKEFQVCHHTASDGASFTYAYIII
jgi:hypothetical protein